MVYKIGMGTAMALCLSAVIGDTLFVITGVPIAQAGSDSIIAFIVVGILTIVIALQFGELGSMMPGQKGVGYSYITRAFGSELGFIAGILLFISFCAIAAAITFSFGGYLLSMLGLQGQLQQIAVAAMLILIISVLNMYGIREAAALSKPLIAITLLAAAVFVAYAIAYNMQHDHLASNFVNLATQNGIPPFVQAATTIVFAYTGFQMVTTFTNNIKGKGRKMAKVLLYSIALGMIAYLAVDVGLLALVPARNSVISSQPLLYALEYASAPEYVIVVVGVGTLIAIAAATIATIYGASRLIYQIGVDGLLPRVATIYDKRDDVAVGGVWISMIVSILMLFSGNLYQIVSISNFGIIFSWIMVCASVISLRRRRSRGTFSAPLYPVLPVIGIVSCMIFLLGLPRESLAIGISIILALLIIFYTIVEIRYREVSRIKLFD